MRSSTVHRNELALRQLAEHAQAFGWDAHTPAQRTRVRVRHQPPYVLTDDELRRLFAAIDSQAMSSYSNKALVDPVLFRVLYGAGLRVSEALNLRLGDVDTDAGTLRIRRLEERREQDGPDHRPARRNPERLCHGRAPGPRDQRLRVLHRRCGQADQPGDRIHAVRGYLLDASIPHFAGGPHPHSLRHGLAVANLRRWAAHDTDLAVMLPYLACYMATPTFAAPSTT